MKGYRCHSVSMQLALAAAFVSCVVGCLCGSARGHAWSPGTIGSTQTWSADEFETATMLGLKFKDPAVKESLDLFDSGKDEEAITNLTKTHQDRVSSDPDRQKELKVALGIIYVRSGAPASKYMAPFDSVKSGDKSLTITRRAKVALAATVWSKKQGGKGGLDLRPRENWFRALIGTKRDNELKLEKEHKLLVNVIKDNSFASVATRLEASGDIINEIDVIELERDKTKEIYKKYIKNLQDSVNLLNGQMDQLRAQIRTLQDKRNRLGQSSPPPRRGGRRGVRQGAGDSNAAARGQIDRQIDGIKQQIQQGVEARTVTQTEIARVRGM